MWCTPGGMAIWVDWRCCVIARSAAGLGWQGEERLARLSCAFITAHLAKDRQEFLGRVDDVISELEDVCERAGIDEASRSLESARLR